MLVICHGWLQSPQKSLKYKLWGVHYGEPEDAASLSPEASLYQQLEFQRAAERTEKMQETGDALEARERGVHKATRPFVAWSSRNAPASTLSKETLWCVTPFSLLPVTNISGRLQEHTVQCFFIFTLHLIFTQRLSWSAVSCLFGCNHSDLNFDIWAWSKLDISDVRGKCLTLRVASHPKSTMLVYLMDVIALSDHRRPLCSKNAAGGVCAGIRAGSQQETGASVFFFFTKPLH